MIQNNPRKKKIKEDTAITIHKENRFPNVTCSFVISNQLLPWQSIAAKN
jgi:hypothetical protein